MKHTLKDCGYCGTFVHRRTMDHAVPECLWGGKALPNSTITIPSCRDCNEYWSYYEGYFRSMAAIMASQSGNPFAKEMVRWDDTPAKCGVVTRHIMFEDRRIGRFLEKTYQFGPAYLPNGLYVGDRGLLKMDWRWWTIVGSKMMRGLFYSKFGFPLPSNYSIDLYQGDGFLTDGRVKSILDSMGEVWQGIGDDDIFLGRCVRDVNDPNVAAFHVVLYRCVSLFAHIYQHVGLPVDPSHPYNVEIDRSRMRRRRQIKRRANGT